MVLLVFLINYMCDTHLTKINNDYLAEVIQL